MGLDFNKLDFLLAGFAPFLGLAHEASIGFPLIYPHIPRLPEVANYVGTIVVESALARANVNGVQCSEVFRCLSSLWKILGHRTNKRSNGLPFIIDLSYSEARSIQPWECTDRTVPVQEHITCHAPFAINH